MALGNLGTPIIQGALSSVLAISVLSTAVSYLFRVFFKIVSLVMFFGFFHAVFLLPVLLSSLRFKFHYKDESQGPEETIKTDSCMHIHKGSNRKWLSGGDYLVDINSDLIRSKPSKYQNSFHNNAI